MGVGKKNALRWLLLKDLQTGTLVTFTLSIATSAITETVDALTKTGLLILAEIRKGELITQIAVTGLGTETSRTCKQCTNDLLKLTKLVFFKRWTNFFVGMWMLVLYSGGNDFSIFLRSNSVDLDVLHTEIELNNEVANF